MKQLNWADFDACVQVLTERHSGRSLNGVFGIPRRGHLAKRGAVSNRAVACWSS